ncbi:hypothetical protein QPR87_02335 [Paracoccus sp. SSJ]|nr:hypothetical protein [Paracoccus sp. SSJ]
MSLLELEVRQRSDNKQTSDGYSQCAGAAAYNNSLNRFQNPSKVKRLIAHGSPWGANNY